MSHQPLDVSALRQRLMKARGRQYWRSLEELARTPEFRNRLENEFPAGAAQESRSLNRRSVLELLGASLGLAGLTACTKQPPEKIVPYVQAPEEIVPGKALYYATAFLVGGVASGVLVESHMGRPVKVEGNPEHPASLGATDAFAQASILGLYDPDRSKTAIRNGRVSSWVSFLAAVNQERERLLTQRGAGLRVLTETVTSPALAHQLRKLRELFPEARWHQYEPAGRGTARAGAIAAFGAPVNSVYRFESAAVVVSLDADFLASGPGSVRYARDFVARRQRSPMNRLNVVEPSPSPTGAMADHRLALTNAEIESFARALAARVGVEVEASTADPYRLWLDAIAADLKRNPGGGLVLAGDSQPPAVHALAAAMNHALGNQGRTVVYTEPLEADPVDPIASLGELSKDFDAGKVETLLILGANPAYSAPADVRFAERIKNVRLRIHLGLYEDETAALCHWHLPEAHAFESWGDARAFDGTVTLLQPLIEPLYAGRSALEFLAAWNGEPAKTGYEIVREFWQGQRAAGEFEKFWRTAVHDGLIAGTGFQPKSVQLKPGFARSLPAAPKLAGTEISFRPDPTVWDGRFANNGWLQELPKPVTKLTWDNAALVSPAMAERLRVSNGDVVELSLEKRSLRAPVWIVPGHADEAVTVHLGYGRGRGGTVAAGTGFNAYVMRTSDRQWSAAGLEIRKTGERRALVSTQDHHSMEGRNLVRQASEEEFRKDPHFAHHAGHDPDSNLTLYPGFPPGAHAWGMAIDLNACTGCGACVVACQAENNIPVVGKKEVARGRAMHWIRIDRYYEGVLDAPAIHHQPVLCMHCENAPCEVVCPTAATVHSQEGLNQMVYNRCVGTRYCSNNCPYKVRRFNFFLYADWTTPSLKLLRNPDVSVRSRGVMEKCSYCVQRINAARIDAEKRERPIRDGEVVTACQGVCPAQAIVFGDISDPASRVARLKKDPRNYGLLTELGTRPRTTYLAKLRNPNPDLEKG